ncbi:MAG TPA: TIGR02996 domain-containing protein [Gemmataceae bacterium]|nr:TIGR02996 domain-containing protein [Gemmataceae bacterium]
MSDCAALLAAIREAPDDDAPRLVYADWLDEHGQPERAEFIRVQCELARHESPALRRREADLLAACHDAFAGPLAAPHLRFRFDRGFIVGFGHTGVFVCGTGSGNFMFRFFPNGHFISGRHHRPPNEIIQRFRRGLPGNDEGRYDLDVSATAAGLQLYYRQSSTICACQGTLEWPWLVIRYPTGTVSSEIRELRYKHFHIRGSVTFTET